MHKQKRWLLYAAILIVCFSFNIKKEQAPDLKNYGHAWEEYDSSLFYRMQSVDDILSYADSTLGRENRQTRPYSELLAATIRKRFYHGYSYYTLQDNWMAWLAGKLVWDHLHAIVLPDDMLKHPMAACSQQAIVLAACFKRAGIAYREVDLHGHFALEGKVQEKWLFFDTNLEPHFVHGRKSLDELIRTGELAPSYSHHLSPEQVKRVFAHPVYCSTNANLAPNGTIFQQVTGFLSLVFPFMAPMMLLGYFVYRKRRRPSRMVDGVEFVAIEEAAEVQEVA